MPLSPTVKPHSALRTPPVLRDQSRVAASSRVVHLAALRVPLVVKLVGANLLVVASLLGVWLMMGGQIAGVVMVVLAIVIVVHLALVLLALRPIRDLETVASRVWHGDFGARVDRSSIADHGVLRVGSMFNILLDDLESDRARMRALAAQVIAVGDRERAALAHELHDSTAQHVAALLLQLSTAARDADDPLLADRLNEARDSAEAILEEVRLLSHTVHPGVLDDLGLEAALRKLARDSSHGNGIDIDVKAENGAERLPAHIEAVLYRVAHETVGNAARHASPTHVRIHLYRLHDFAILEVHDDGGGFDLREAAGRPGTGLLSIRERLALVDGWLDIKTANGSGTTISATVPLGEAADSIHLENA